MSAIGRIVAAAVAGRRGETVPGDRRRVAQGAIHVLVVLWIVSALASIAIGPVSLSFGDIARTLLQGAGLMSDDGSGDVRRTLILMEIRLPRTILALLVGGALAVAGAIMQGLFRNPLADPGIVGVSEGASLGAVFIIVLGSQVIPAGFAHVQHFFLPAFAFAGALAVTAVLYKFSTRLGVTSTPTLLLAGIAMGALASAFVGVLVYISDDQQLRDLTFWRLGSLGGATWPKILAIMPFIVPVFVFAPLLARGLNAQLLGEAEARHLGIDVQTLKRQSVFLVACAAGASVAVTGVIGFVGIIVPHLLRLRIGPDHGYLLWACVLLGGILLVVADIFARMVVAPAELPIGIVTAAIGAPFFLWLLLRRRSMTDG